MKNGTVECHLLWRDAVAPQQIQYVFSVKKREHFIGTFVSDTLPPVRIDVIHHKCDVVLRIQSKIFAFGNEHPDILMVPLRGTFLVWGAGIAVKDAGPSHARPVEFDRFRVGELTSVVRKAYPENAGKPIVTKSPVQVIEDIDDRSRVVMVTKESQHHFGFYEVDREKDFAALFPFNGIEFGDRGIRVILHKNKEILVFPADAASLVHLDGNGPGAGTETDLSGKVDVPCGYKTGIDETVNGAFAHHEGVFIRHADMMRRLFLPDQWRDDLIKMAYLLFGKRDAGSGPGEQFLIFLLCLVRIIIALFKGAAGVSGKAGIANIGRFQELRANHFHEIGTVIVAGRTVSAFLIVLIGPANLAYTDFFTGEPVCTGVVINVSIADTHENEMVADLFGNGGRILIESPSDLSKGTALINHIFNDGALFQGKMFLGSHVSTSLLPGHSKEDYSTETRNNGKF